MDLKDFDNFHVASFVNMATQQIEEEREKINLGDITKEQIYCVLGSGISMLRNQLRDNNEAFEKVTKEVADKMRRAYQEDLKQKKEAEAKKENEVKAE